MDTRDKQSSHLSIVEAVETLSEIADMDIEHGVVVSQRHDMRIGEETLSYRTVHWLNKQDAERGLSIIKETFRVILNYLRHFYREETSYVSNEKAVEGIKTIMVLVGEAAKKLDRYTHLFHLTKNKSIVELKEYKKLQEFYQSKIAYKIDESKLGKWLLALSKSALSRKKETKLIGKANQQTKHIFVDLDTVKKDSEYELFFLRKEDGTRFFSSRLLRNMKLISDFGSYFDGKTQEDPLEHVNEWVDRYYQNAALDVLVTVGSLRNRFFREAFKYKENELAQALGNCLLALMMGSNPRNSIKFDPQKTCTQYFEDFQMFLREGIKTREYAKLVAYPPNETNQVGQCLLDLVHALCKGLYFCGDGYREISAELHKILDDVKKTQNVDQQSEATVWGKLNNEYQALHKMFKGHQNAPLLKTLNALEEGNYHTFDPLSQQTMQSRLFNLVYDSQKILNVRMGCPIIQEYVHKAIVNDEFKAFLRSCCKDSDIRNILLINLQDRTSWKDHIRCTVLEELQHHPDFSDVLAVATIPKDTDFYHQQAPYDQENKAEAFIGSFKGHFGEESSGYYFPQPLYEILNEEFVDGILRGIHKIFYGEKNMLLRDHRLNFIEIFDVLITLKIVESAQADCFSLLCKDGVDGGASMNALLYSFLKIVNQEDGLSLQEWRELNILLHVPAMIVRERLVQQDKIERVISALKTIESVKEECGAKAFIKLFHETFGPLFSTSILKSEVVPVKQ